MFRKSSVDRHGRAWCDVGVGVNEAKVVIELCCAEPPGRAALSAAEAQEWNEKVRLQKAKELVHFQRTVKERVCKKEKLIEREFAAAAAQRHQSEQVVVERAFNTKAAKSVEVGLDVEDIQVVASGKQSRFRMTDVSSRPPSLQAARQYLLSYSSKKRTDCSLAREQLSSSQSKTSTVGYRNVEQMSCHSCMKRLSSGSAGSSDSSSITSSLSSASSSSSSMSSAASSPSLTVTKNLKPAKKLEDMDQRRAGQQFLLFRRLYSELEREKVRRVRQQRNQSKKMECIKKKKETERRLVEEEMGAPNAVQDSLLSTDTTEDRQQVEKWQELLADEARKQELQRVKEVERYILALKAQLRDKMERKKVTVSPLCFCGETIWDTDPQKCANNCTFHKNSQEYIRALTNLLQSLDMV